MKTRLWILVAAGLVLIVGAWFALRGDPKPAAPDLDEGSSALEQAASQGDVPRETPAVVPLHTAPFVPPAPAEGGPTSADEPEHCTLRGIALDPTGAPVENVTVYGAPIRDGWSRISEEGILAIIGGGPASLPDAFRHKAGSITRTAGDGTFEFAELPGDADYDVAAVSAELGIVVEGAIPLDPKAPAEVTLRFPAALLLFGRIVDSEGEPIPGSRVGIDAARDGKHYQLLFTTSAGRDGVWRSPPLGHAKLSVSAGAPGFRSRHRFVSWDPATERELQIDFVLERAPVLRGRLLRPDGSPARLAEALGRAGIRLTPRNVGLVASDEEPRAEQGFLAGRNLEDRIDFNEDRWEYTCYGELPRFVSLWCGGLQRRLLGFGCPSEGRETDLVLHLDRLDEPLPKVTIFVRVTERRGDAVDAAKAQLITQQNDVPVGLFLRFDSAEQRPGVLVRGEVLPGHHALQVEAPGFVPRRIPLEIDGAELERSIDVALDPATLDLTVLAEAADGTPVPGVRIHVLDRVGAPVDLPRRIESNAEGQVILRGLSAGEYQILAAHPRFARAGRRVTLHEGMGPLILRLVEGEEIRLKFEGYRGPCSLRIADARGTTVVEDACSHRRRFGGALERLVPGSYRITVRSPGCDPVERDFEAARGAIVTIDLR